MSEKKLGVFFSYASMLISSLLSIIITPFMLRTMGDVEYGLYQTISSFVGVLAVLDFGSGVAATKYIAEFNLKNDRAGGNNYLGMALIVNTVICGTICIVGTGFIFSIDRIYSGTFTPAELQEAKLLAVLYISNMVIGIFTNIFVGAVNAYKRFSVASGTNLIRLILRFALIYVLLRLGLKAVAISIADLIASVLFTVYICCFSVFKLRAYPKLVKWDRKLFRGALLFSSALFIQSIVMQINNSIDKVLLGSILGGTATAIYSVAMNVYLIYGSLSGAIRRVMLPDAVKLINDHADATAITDFVIEGGRYQFIFLIYVLCGFVLAGQEFIRLWVGEGYHIAYYIALLLMLPMLFQLSTNLTEPILDAMGKRMMRSIILAAGAAFNIGITIVLVKSLGVIGAPIGTAISCVCASLVGLNIYHKKIMGLQIRRMFFSIFDRTLVCALAAMAATFLLDLLRLRDLYALLAKGCVFSALYFILMWCWGFSKTEKATVKHIAFKVLGRKGGKG